MSDNPIVVEAEAFLGQFKTAAGAITALSLLVGLAGTAGILSTDWTVAIKAVLDAALGIVLLITHQTATKAVAVRAAAKVAVTPPK